MKVIKIGASWCSGCVVMRPIWDKLEAYFNDLETVYYDYDFDEDMVLKYNVGDILPVFIFMDKNDNQLCRINGEVSYNRLKELIIEYWGM